MAMFVSALMLTIGALYSLILGPGSWWWLGLLLILLGAAFGIAKLRFSQERIWWTMAVVVGTVMAIVSWVYWGWDWVAGFWPAWKPTVSTFIAILLFPLVAISEFSLNEVRYRQWIESIDPNWSIRFSNATQMDPRPLTSFRMMAIRRKERLAEVDVAGLLDQIRELERELESKPALVIQVGDDPYVPPFPRGTGAEQQVVGYLLAVMNGVANLSVHGAETFGLSPRRYCKELIEWLTSTPTRGPVKFAEAINDRGDLGFTDLGLSAMKAVVGHFHPDQPNGNGH